MDQKAETAPIKTKARISKRGIVENIVLRQESDAASGLTFNHLQDIILKSIESMMSLSPKATVKFLESIKEEILPQAEQNSNDYETAVKAAIESLEVEVMSDEEFKTFCQEREQKSAQEVPESTEEKQGLGLVQTTWEE